MAWAALVALAAIVNFSVKGMNEPENSGEIVEDTVTDDEYEELKKALDKAMKGHR